MDRSVRVSLFLLLALRMSLVDMLVVVCECCLALPVGARKYRYAARLPWGIHGPEANCRQGGTLYTIGKTVRWDCQVWATAP
jgi:hypothetical protein